jgi:hypothetical protein
MNRMTPLHRGLIAEYVARNPGTETRGFVTALERVIRKCSLFNLEHGGYRKALRYVFPVGFQPDAFRIDWEAKSLTLVEAEVTSRISAQKWQDIVDLWWTLDTDEWDLFVHTVDRHSSTFAVDMPLVASFDCYGEKRAELMRSVAERTPGEYVWRHGDERQRPEPEWVDRCMLAAQHLVASGFYDDLFREPLRAAAPEVYDFNETPTQFHDSAPASAAARSPLRRAVARLDEVRP